MYLAITGKSRQELTGLEAQTTYCQRFDVEVNYRFCNQSLLMNELHTRNQTSGYLAKHRQAMLLATFCKHQRNNEN